jgi:hypothetical protein
MNNKPFNLVVGLLYPAVLGTIIYNFVDNFDMMNIGKYPFVALILILYVLDYLYTNTEKIKDDYSWWNAIFDFFIISCSFVAINASCQVIKFSDFFNYIPILMAAHKIFGLGWELRRTLKDKFAIIYFSIFGILYAVIQGRTLGNPFNKYFLIILIIDVCVYLCYDRLNPFCDKLICKLSGNNSIQFKKH